MGVGVLSTLFAILALTVYFYVKKKFQYWKNKGVVNDEPSFIFGNIADVILAKKSIHEHIKEQYESHNEPVVGFYGFIKPILVIRDLKLLKYVLIKDFNYFTNRALEPDEHYDPLTSEIMFAKWDDEWKSLRKKSSPAFSSGRLKSMYPLIRAVGRNLNTLCKETVEKGQSSIAIRDFCSRYAVDMIASCALGCDGESIRNPEKSFLFQTMGKAGNSNFSEGLSSNLMFFALPLYVAATRLGIKIFRDSTVRGVYSLVERCSKQRIESGLRTGDIFDQILWSNDPEFQGLKKKAGAVFQMLLAGAETSALTLMFVLYELARNVDIQKKVQREIRDAINKNNGEITFELLRELEYLDQIVKETLRLWPVLPFLERMCSKDYRLPGTDIVVDKRTIVLISIWGVQRDPKHFPEPDVFKPERFSKENAHNIPDMAYMPFGAGPRYCIGLRLGLISVKSFLVHFLKDFDVNLTEPAKKTFQWSPHAVTLHLKEELILNISPSEPS